MDGSLYFPVFLLITSVLCTGLALQYIGSTDYKFLERGNPSMLFPALICIVFAFWIGDRPVFSLAFGDTFSYAAIYLSEENEISVEFGKEWFLGFLMMICRNLGLTVSDFLTVVALGYTISLVYAVKILMPNNILLGLLFCFSSFSFFTFASNGIRNGLGCHLCILAMALYLNDKYTQSVLFALIAFSTHKSVILPLASFFAAIYVLKQPKMAVYCWIASIFVSLVAGGYFTALFASLGFDDRMTQYTDTGLVGQTGGSFRWDFLLYSSMPVLMYWYVCVAREVGDNWYRVLGATYCLANSFWVLVIRAAFSNRFAYLSWFIYPIVIAYPLVNIKIWPDHDQKTGIILFAYLFLTIAICYFTGLI